MPQIHIKFTGGAETEINVSDEEVKTFIADHARAIQSTQAKPFFFSEDEHEQHLVCYRAIAYYKVIKQPGRVVNIPNPW